MASAAIKYIVIENLYSKGCLCHYMGFPPCGRQTVCLSWKLYINRFLFSWRSVVHCSDAEFYRTSHRKKRFETVALNLDVKKETKWKKNQNRNFESKQQYCPINEMGSDFSEYRTTEKK